MPPITNPFMDQGRVDFLQARVNASQRKGLLSAWPRTDRELPVVELEVSWVKFSTLNHRTKAEQRREIVRAGQQNLFSGDPLGNTAQEAQLKILTLQAGFEDLKNDLAERGQREHAVITADGVLINGNRRAAALLSLFRVNNNLNCRYVRCLVLPADATPAEIIQLETELQVAQDFKEDYSWVNEALLIEELYNENSRDFDRVAAMMHRNVADIKEDYEKIQQVNQLVELSNGAWLHVDFEPNESAFDELAQHIKNKTDDEKSAVRSVYFLGTLAGVNYRDLRHLRRADCRSLVEAELNGDQQLAPVLNLASQPGQLQANADDSLLDSVLGANQETSKVTQVVNLLARLDRNSPVTLPDGTAADLADVRGQIARAVQKAADEAAEQKKDLTAVSAPIMRMESAIQNLERVRDTLSRARSLNGWNEERFESLLKGAKDLMDEIESTGT